MAYLPSQEYSPVPTSDTVIAVVEPARPSAEVVERIKSSSRVVAFFCFIQLVLAALGLFTSGSIIMFCITAVFVSLGAAGVSKRRPRLLVAHFVYSIVVYVLSLIALVYVVLYCDDCSWVVYAVIGLWILIQAIGLKHSRMLIWAINLANGTSCARRCPRETVIMQEVVPAPTSSSPVAPAAPAADTRSFVQQSAVGTQSSTVSTSGPAPTAPMQPMMMYPPLGQFQHFQNFQQQGYPMPPYPFQPYGYPMMGQVQMPQPPAVYRPQQ